MSVETGAAWQPEIKHETRRSLRQLTLDERFASRAVSDKSVSSGVNLWRHGHGELKDGTAGFVRHRP